MQHGSRCTYARESIEVGRKGMMTAAAATAGPTLVLVTERCFQTTLSDIHLTSSTKGRTLPTWAMVYTYSAVETFRTHSNSRDLPSYPHENLNRSYTKIEGQ